MRGRILTLLCSIGLTIVAYATSKPTQTIVSDDSNLTVFATVDHVVDGDTLVLSDRETVRLIGIDTPELHHPSRPVEYYATEAKEFVEHKLKNHQVKLEFGKEKRDKYNRLLAYVYLSDGTFLNAEIIKQGYGFAYTRFPFEFSDEFVKYENEASQAKRGIWAGEGANELKWIISQKRLPLKIYDLENNKWAIEYGGIAKTYLTLEELSEELEFLRNAVYSLSPRDLNLECVKRGWIQIDSERKGVMSNEN